MSGSVYVIGADVGPQKIGITSYPETRLQNLQTGSHAQLKLHFVAEVADDQCRDVEAYAHWLLRDQRERGEWFNVTPQQAQEAVTLAVERVAAGDRASKAESISTLVSLSVSGAEAEIPAVLAWMRLHDVRSMSYAIRCMIRFGLANHVKPDAEPDGRKNRRERARKGE